MSRHQFRGQVAAQPKKKTFSQLSTRRGGVTYDQDDRPFAMQTENASGMPTGPLQPLFTAPWYPDFQFIIVNPDDTSECYVDYPAMFAERRAGMQEYHKNAQRLCAAKSWDAPKRLGDYTREVMDTLGDPPQPLEPVAAALQKNPWLLGYSTTPDPRLAKYIADRSPTVIDRDLADFDFGPESYSAEVGGVERERAREGRTLRMTPAQQAELRRLRELEALREAERLEEEQLAAAIEEEEASAGDAVDEEETALADLLGDVDAGVTGAGPGVVPEDEEEAHDPQALGGRTVQPRKTAIAAKQAPRRPSQTSVPRKTATKRSTQGRPRAGAENTASDKAARPAGRFKSRAEWRKARADKPSLAEGGAAVVSGTTDE